VQASDRVTIADVAGASTTSRTVAILMSLPLRPDHLASFRQPLQESGAEGARRLCAWRGGERLLPLRQALAIEVVQRGSSGRSAGQRRQTSYRSGSHSSLNSALEAR
jgi:hypothetical protein